MANKVTKTREMTPEEQVSAVVQVALSKGKTETEVRRAFERALDRARHA